MGTQREGDNRLDKTLSSEAFSRKDGVSQIVKNNILKSSLAEDDIKEKLGGKHVDEVTQFWSGKIYAFLDELRSASAKHTGKLKPTDETDSHSREWKLKDETDRYRVMYREGPEGTPFHTLCLDGVVDGNFTSALCVAWESPMYKEWWPHFTIPKFEIIESKYLKRVRAGQDLSLMRFKVPWPLAQREVVISAFEVEYFEDDIVIGLVESIPETLEVSEKVHGFSKADLPPSSGHVRMDVGGGFVMQRTSKDQFYFRTILSVDMKLDFVPPWLINFISRQVAGQGLKLYQKAVLAVSNGTGSGKAFQKPLKTGQMYERVRSGLEARKEANGVVHTSHVIAKPPPLKDNLKAKSLQGSIRRMGSSEYTRVVPYPDKPDETKESSTEDASLTTDESAQPVLASAPERPEGRAVEEVKSEEGSVGEINFAGSSKGVIPKSKISLNEEDHREYDDPELDWAISVLDKMIAYTRSRAAEQATASQYRESQSPRITLHSKEAKSKEALVESTGKYAGPLEEKESCNIVLVKPFSASKSVQKSNNGESSRSRVLQSAGGDAESSSCSEFWSASEIEVVSSQDDTDTDGASGSLITGQTKAQGPEVESRRRRKKWRWTCFSKAILRRHVEHGRTSVYGQDPGRASGVHLRSRMGESARYATGKGYRTDSDEIQAPRHSLGSRTDSPDSFATLGQLLLDKRF